MRDHTKDTIPRMQFLNYRVLEGGGGRYLGNLRQALGALGSTGEYWMQQLLAAWRPLMVTQTQVPFHQGPIGGR